MFVVLALYLADIDVALDRWLGIAWKKRKDFFTNLAAAAIGFWFNLLLIFLTPYIIESLGSEAYSFIPLTNIVGYSNIITVAFYSMTGRFVSVEYNRDNKEKASIFLIRHCFPI